MPRIEPFEHHASDYEEWFEQNPLAYQAELDAIKLLLPKEGKGLEIGVGSGRFAVPLGISIGIDPSPQMRQLAVQRGIMAIEGVAENLPFRNNQFDFALMVTTVCFLDDVLKAFKETFRVLKSTGSFLVGFVDKKSQLGQIYEARKETHPFYRFATFYSTEEIIQLLKDAGFRSFQFSQTIFSPLDQIKTIPEVRFGYGEGAFVVIKSDKK